LEKQIKDIHSRSLEGNINIVGDFFAILKNKIVISTEEKVIYLGLPNYLIKRL
jgi:hypothetical protein